MGRASEKKIRLKNDSLIESYTLVSQPARRGKIFLGSKEVDRFLIVDSIWEPLVWVLREPKRVDGIIKQLIKDNPGAFSKKEAALKIKVMLLSLITQGLIKKVDGVVVNRKKKNKQVKPWIRKISRIFVNRYVVWFYLFFALIPFLLLPFYDELVPRPDDFFWHERFSVSFLSFFVLSWVLGAVHELAHFMVAASQGVASKIRISFRLNYLVLETRYRNIYSLSRFWRIATFLSGIVVDMMIVAVINLILLGFIFYMPEWLIGLLLQILLFQWLSFFWNFLFYMKTDVYFVMRELLEVENLYDRSWNRIVSLLGRGSRIDKLDKRSEVVVNFYMLFFALGTVIALFRYGFFHIPILLKLTLGGFESMLLGFSGEGSDIFLVDGVIVIGLEILSVLMLLNAMFVQRRNG